MLDILNRWRLALIHWVALIGGRLLLPGAGRRHAEELRSGAYDMSGPEPECLRVEDVGADTTIISFSSAGFLHPGGLPTFAFTRLFQRQEAAYNTVFLRDVHRTAYHLSPAGRPDGLAFHEALIRETMARLGPGRYIAIGESSGAAAAVYFGSRCAMDQVIAFSVPYPLGPWTSWRVCLRTLFDVRTLLREPGAYWEVLLITGFSVLAHRSLKRTVGPDQICDPAQTYGAAERRPKLTLFYGERCRADTTIADGFKRFDEAKLVPVPTGRHMLWIPLARMGGLERRIMGEIATGRSAGLRTKPAGHQENPDT